MAIAVDPNYDKPQRIISTANLQQFAGVNHQLLIEKETNRPIVMDGKTIGGAFKCASKDELDGVVDSALTKQEANETYLGINDEAQSAKSVEWSGLTDVPNNVKNAVSFTAQTLNEVQKTQARTNIGAASPNDIPQGDFADYLPLDGSRIMTGPVRSTPGESNPALHYGNVSTDGGGLWLFSNSNPTYKGGFILRAHNSDGVAYCELRGDSGGDLFWRDNNIPLVQDSVSIPGWVKFRGTKGAGWAFIWGSFNNVSSSNDQVINLPITIQTMVYGSANPNGNGANNHITVRQVNTTQIVIAGSGEVSGRSGQWFVLAHCVY